MTAVSARAPVQPPSAARRPGLAAARLLRLELRHNAMPWLLPVAVALFWLTGYRKIMAMPPLWYPRATNMQTDILVTFITPVVGAAAWMGSRDARRRTVDLVTITARPRWARLLATWAATTGWAMVGYLICLAAVYGVTAQQASWGGPLWWPAAVAAASLPALSALGFAAGTLLPSRFTAPMVGLAAFFALALSTQLITGSQSYWQISPVVAGPWDSGHDPGVATFYPYVPDLSIAQVIFLLGLTVVVLATLILPAGSGGRWSRRAAAAVAAAGLLAAGTAVALAGTGNMDAHGMITIPALHNAASDRPIRYTPVCSHTAIPVCLNPAYKSYLPGTAAALAPMLAEIAGLPGAPARISQAATVYHQETGNSASIGQAGSAVSGNPPVYHILLPDQLGGPATAVSELASEVRLTAAPNIVANFVGDHPGASQAQHAVTAALMMAADLPLTMPPGPRGNSADLMGQPPAEVAPSSPAYAAARRFAALPASARHAWLVRHLGALRAGRITLAQLP